MVEETLCFIYSGYMRGRGERYNDNQYLLKPPSKYFASISFNTHNYPHQCSCLENSKDKGAWQATVHGVTKSWTQVGHN